MKNLHAIASCLGDSGLCIEPDFLDSELTQSILSDLQELKASGQFSRAGTGQRAAHEVRNLIRRDEICWLEESQANPVQQQLWETINALKQAFNRVLYMGLRDFEGHYASYPEGGFYTKHVDSFQHDPARVVSLILYLNQGWQAKDGGHLRVHHEGTVTDIEPTAGKLVCFLSHELEHEVLLNHETRLSFSGWFKN